MKSIMVLLLFSIVNFVAEKAVAEKAVAEEVSPSSPLIEIIVGQEWVARDGSFWRILAIDSVVTNYPVVAMNTANGQVEYYTAQGRAHINGAESQRDLIRPNVPTISVRNWTIIIHGTPAECTLSEAVAENWKDQGAEVLELKGQWP